MADVSSDQYRRWTPAAQQRALERLQELQNNAWRPFYCVNPKCDGMPHDDWAWSHARADQRPPEDDEWLVWAAISGRGSGKSRSGSEYVNRLVEVLPRIIIVAPTSGDLREVVVEGESGIMATARPGRRPEFEPSKRRLTWPNGSRALLISAEEPERLRGPQSHFAWMDEFCIYPDMAAVWDNLSLGLRLGQRPRVLITTTPKPRPLLREILAARTTRVSRASTYDNLVNLAPTFAEKIIKRFEGTRVGRQALHAEILADIEGALWTWDMVESARVAQAPYEMQRIVIGVDPAGTANKGSDETGIVVAGHLDDKTYVLEDLSGKYSPHGWALVVRHAYERHSADAIVVETNYGGDMVEHTLRTSGVEARIVKIHAKRGKAVRAEPVVSLFEQRRLHMLPGLSELENEMTSWVPYEGESPNRVDAMVYAVMQLNRGMAPARISSPLRLVRNA